MSRLGLLQERAELEQIAATNATNLHLNCWRHTQNTVEWKRGFILRSIFLNGYVYRLTLV